MDLDYRAAARASMRPRLMMPSYWFWWVALRLAAGAYWLACRWVWTDHAGWLLWHARWLDRVVDEWFMRTQEFRGDFD